MEGRQQQTWWGALAAEVADCVLLHVRRQLFPDAPPLRVDDPFLLEFANRNFHPFHGLGIMGIIGRRQVLFGDFDGGH